MLSDEKKIRLDKQSCSSVNSNYVHIWIHFSESIFEINVYRSTKVRAIRRHEANILMIGLNQQLVSKVVGAEFRELWIHALCFIFHLARWIILFNYFLKPNYNDQNLIQSDTHMLLRMNLRVNVRG